MYTIPFLTAKLLDIGCVTVYYFFAAFVLSWIVDRWMGPFDKEHHEKKPLLRLIAEILFQFFLLGVLTYVMRNIIGRIPFPLEGLGGFQHERLKEAHEAGVFVIVFLFFQEHLALSLKHLAVRLADRADNREEDANEPASGLGRFM